MRVEFPNKKKPAESKHLHFRKDLTNINQQISWLAI